MATSKNDITAFIRSPYINLLPFMVKLNPEKSGTFAMAPISGVRMSFTRAFTTEVNAAPITTPTAKSIAFPLNIKFLKPSNIFFINLILMPFNITL